MRLVRLATRIRFQLAHFTIPRPARYIRYAIAGLMHCHQAVQPIAIDELIVGIARIVSAHTTPANHLLLVPIAAVGAQALFSSNRRGRG